MSEHLDRLVRFVQRFSAMNRVTNVTICAYEFNGYDAGKPGWEDLVAGDHIVELEVRGDNKHYSTAAKTSEEAARRMLRLLASTVVEDAARASEEAKRTLERAERLAALAQELEAL